MHTSFVQLNLSGSWCNEWPTLRVRGNETIYFDGSVIDNISIEFSMPLNALNTLEIEHYGKSFGENGRWDTLVEDGQITQDRAVKINHICLDEVDLIDYLFKNFPMKVGQETISTDYMGHNGVISIAFESPVYNWIIKTFVAPKERNKPTFDLVVETSFGNLFDYSQDLLEIEEIENILIQNAHLIDKPSAIRNTPAAS
jgi:hypothetical protein